MKLKIEIDYANAAMHDNPLGETQRILDTVVSKLEVQLERDGRCICEAKESADVLQDINGNTVGTVKLIKEEPDDQEH